MESLTKCSPSYQTGHECRNNGRDKKKKDLLSKKTPDSALCGVYFSGMWTSAAAIPLFACKQDFIKLFMRFFPLAMTIKSKTFVDVLVPAWGGEKNKLKYCNGLNLFLTNHVPEWHPKSSTNYMFCGVT